MSCIVRLAPLLVTEAESSRSRPSASWAPGGLRCHSPVPEGLKMWGLMVLKQRTNSPFLGLLLQFGGCSPELGRATCCPWSVQMLISSRKHSPGNTFTTRPEIMFYQLSGTSLSSIKLILKITITNTICLQDTPKFTSPAQTSGPSPGPRYPTIPSTSLIGLLPNKPTCSFPR